METLEQVHQFLDGAVVMEISIPSKTDCYQRIALRIAFSMEIWRGLGRTNGDARRIGSRSDVG